MYTCADYPASGWCPLAGFEPGSGAAWRLAWTLRGSCVGTLAPSPSPSSSLPNRGGCPVEYAAGVQYREGDLVSKSGMVFRCNDHPVSLFCSQLGYEPLSTGHGDAYKIAWSTVGPCSGTVAPSTAPGPLPGCPELFAPSGAYLAGSRVSRAAAADPAVVRMYECKGWPFTPYCTQVGFEPGSGDGYMAWRDLGQCSGTTAPPPPTPCNHPKYTTTIGPEREPCGYAGSTDCICVPDPANGGAYACTKPVVRTVVVITATQPWSDSTTYLPGDEVRVGNKAFKCKDHPYTGWCGEKMYAPALGDGGLWTEAWTAVGDCKDNTYSPTSPPTTSKPTFTPSFKPTSNPTSKPTFTPSFKPTSKPSQGA